MLANNCFLSIATLLVAVDGVAISKTSLSRMTCHDGHHLVVGPGETWTDRCMKCRCDETLGAVCEEPVCKIPYKAYHKQSCVKWSPDGCCCEEFGCKSGGVVYAIGQYFPFPAGDPCGQCLCEMDTDHMNCTKKICAPPMCVDSYLRGNDCCPRCPSKPNCNIPFIEGVNAFNNRDLHTPLLLGRRRQLTSSTNALLIHECTCLVPGGPATCRPQKFTWLGR